MTTASTRPTVPPAPPLDLTVGRDWLLERLEQEVEAVLCPRYDPTAEDVVLEQEDLHANFAAWQRGDDDDLIAPTLRLRTTIAAGPEDHEITFAVQIKVISWEVTRTHPAAPGDPVAHLTATITESEKEWP